MCEKIKLTLVLQYFHVLQVWQLKISGKWMIELLSLLLIPPLVMYSCVPILCYNLYCMSFFFFSLYYLYHRLFVLMGLLLSLSRQYTELQRGGFH